MKKWKEILLDHELKRKEDSEKLTSSVNDREKKFDEVMPLIIEKVDILRKTLSEFSSVKVTDPEIINFRTLIWKVRFPKHAFVSFLIVSFNVQTDRGHRVDRIWCNAKSIKVTSPTTHWESINKESIDELIEEFLERYKDDILGRAVKTIASKIIDKIW